MPVDWKGFDRKLETHLTEARRRLKSLVSGTPEVERIEIVDRSGKFGPEVEVSAEIVGGEVVSVTRHGGTRTHALQTSIDDLSRVLERRAESTRGS